MDGVYDALSDAQRDLVAPMLNEQLQRMPEHGGRGEGRGEGEVKDAGVVKANMVAVVVEWAVIWEGQSAEQ